MSWSRRNILRAGLQAGLAAATLPLPGCGWRPLYGKTATGPGAPSGGGNATIDAHLAAIKVKTPVWERSASPFAEGGLAKYDARTAQALHNALRDGLNPYGQPTTPAYELGIELTERITETLTSNSGDAEREDLMLKARYLLQDARGNDLLLAVSRATIGYAVLQEPYTDLVARNDARERAARQVADFMKLRLSAYFAQHG